MALKIVKGRTFPIGLDIGSSTIKLVQLRQVDENFELLAAGSATLPANCRERLDDRLAFLAERVPTIVKSNTFSGRDCIMSLPAANTFVQHVKLPKLPPEQTLNALRWELSGKTPFAIDNAVIRYVVAGDVFGDGDTKQELIAVAVANNVLNGYLAAARRCKLNVVGVNIESCAVLECFARLFRRSSDVARTIMFIDLGASTTQVVMSHGNRMVFARNIARGEKQLDAAVAKGLGVPADQAHSMRWDLLQKPDSEESDSVANELYRCLENELDEFGDELTQCLRYYESVFRNQPIERAIFVGGQAYDKRLCQLVAQRLNLPAQIGDPLLRVKRLNEAGMDIGLDRRTPQPDWAVAVGLSLGAAVAA